MKASRVLVLCGLLTAAGAYAAKPVLRINGTEISDVDVDRIKPPAAANAQGGPADDRQAFRNALEQLISRTLILQAAREAKVTIDPAKVAASVDAQRVQAGGAESFAKKLAAHGVTEQEYTRVMEENAILQAYMKGKVVDQTIVSDAEIKGYYDQHPDEFKHPEQVKLRMILAKTPSNADEATKNALKAKIEGVRQKLVTGADFAATAKETSDHPNKSVGGEVGWIRQGMLPEMEKYFWDLKPGAISQVADGKFGFVIFKVDERRPAGVMVFEEVKDNLGQMLRTRKADEKVRKLIADLRAKAKIEALDPAVKAALEAPVAPPPVAPVGGTVNPASAAKPVPPPVPTQPAGNAPKSP
jgi:peptidyl-prolyl cis-trans isomerase C